MRSVTLRRCLAALALAGCMAACGSPAPLTVTISVEPGDRQLDDLARLDYRVYTVEDLDEVLASATNPNGSPVQAISCEVLATAAPDATGCTETERRVTRDQQLLASGAVPADGVITVDGGQRVRVYASLRPDELRMDEQGQICSWNGNRVVDDGETDAEVQVRPFC